MTSATALTGELDLILPITALLPLTAILLVAQGDPYQTLVLRAILGSVATLLYALLGAPDVAITEALVGTLLSTTLYAVALRSSMVLHLLVCGSERPSRDDQQILRHWLAPAFLQMRLHLPDDDQEGALRCHGRLESGGRLVLHNRRLAERLSSLDGYRRWEENGGSLDLEPETAR